MQAAGANGQSCLHSSVGTWAPTAFVVWFSVCVSPSVLDDSAEKIQILRRECLVGPTEVMLPFLGQE